MKIGLQPEKERTNIIVYCSLHTYICSVKELLDEKGRIATTVCDDPLLLLLFLSPPQAEEGRCQKVRSGWPCPFGKTCECKRSDAV